MFFSIIGVIINIYRPIYKATHIQRSKDPRTFVYTLHISIIRKEIEMRVMAIDFGDARTGIAISDMTGSLTGETMVVQSYNSQKAADEIARIAVSRNVELIVLGYPRNMDGSAGPRAEKSQAFSQVLKDLTGLEVVLWDERRTTIDAHRILSENSRHGKKRKDRVDAVAASLILEGYLGYLKNH